MNFTRIIAILATVGLAAAAAATNSTSNRPFSPAEISDLSKERSAIDDMEGDMLSEEVVF